MIFSRYVTGNHLKLGLYTYYKNYLGLLLFVDTPQLNDSMPECLEKLHPLYINFFGFVLFKNF